MSIAEIERFAADINSNAALRAESEKAFAQASQAASLDGVLTFATAKGYNFTASEMTEHAKAKAGATGKQIADAELDGVSAGFAQSIGPEAVIGLLLMGCGLLGGGNSDRWVG